MKEHAVDNGSTLALEHQPRDRKYMKIMSEMFREGKLHDLQAVAHGDARSNNMLYKYDSGSQNPIGAKLVDFQDSFFCNPFFDLVYFLMLSVPANLVRQQYMDLLGR